MKKSVWIILAAVAFLAVFGITKNNTMVELRGATEKDWANVQSAYQRRADLIGNLVKVVQGAADFERTTLKEIMEARTKATSMNIDASKLTPEMLSQFQETQAGLSSALSRLLVTVERYPDLKTSANFTQLQSQIEGTENRINVARDQYNNTATIYNVFIRKFPNSLIASFTNNTIMPLFQAQEKAQNAPEIEFNFN
ncbi:MAG: LemA family protein [Capnocytophaga sp.]|nr:LemA family protein [Capnocytophaga sp.]